MPESNFRSEPVDAPFGAEAVAWSGFSWEEARRAIEGQERGASFWLAAQLAVQSLRYPPIRAAVRARRALSKGLPYSVDGPDRAPGRIETASCEQLWKEHGAPLLTSMFRDIAFHGFSVLMCPSRVLEDGRREVTSVERWPIGAVGYSDDEIASPRGGTVRGYYAIDAEGAYHQLPKPGKTDGFWLFVGSGDRPHLDGAVTSLDVQYVAGAVAERARANVLGTAGKVSPVITMPENTKTDGDEGKAAQAVAAGLGTKKAAAVLPGGSKLDRFELGAQTYAFFGEALTDRIIMIELAILNRAGVVTRESAQYVASEGLETVVPESLIREDVETVEASWSSLFEMLSELNGLARERAPRLNGHMPNSDRDAAIEAEQTRREADDAHRKAEIEALTLFHAALEAESKRFPLTQERIDALAALYRVPAPQLPEGGAAKNPEIFAYHLDGDVLTRGAAAALLGFPPPPNPELTVSQFKALVAASQNTPATQQNPPQNAPAAPAPSAAPSPPAPPA